MKRNFILSLLLCSGMASVVQAQQAVPNETVDPSDVDTTLYLDEQVVVGHRMKRLSLFRLPVTLSETPLTMAIVDSKALRDLNITDLLQINKTTAGIRIMNNYGGFHMFRARGMDGLVLLSNGIRDERAEIYSCAPTSSFVGVDRVEVIKGPSSALIGHSAIGGIINVLYSQPSARTSVDARIAVGSWNTYTAQVGATGALSPTVNFRLDYTGIQSDGWRDNTRRSNNVYAALDFRPNDRNKFSFSALAYDNRVHTDPGIPRFQNDIFDENGNKVYSKGDIPTGIDLAKTSLTYVNDHLNDKHISSTNIWEHNLSENWLLRDVLGFSYNTLSYLQSEEFSHLTSKTPGRYKHYYMNGDEKVYISVDSILREPFHFDYDNYYAGNQLSVQGQFEALGMRHLASFGYDFSYMSLKRWQGQVFSGPAISTVMSIRNPISNPGYLDEKFSQIVDFIEYYHSLAAFDQINVTDRLAAMLALRYNMFRRNITTSKSDDRVVTEKGEPAILIDNAPTFKVGLVYELTPGSRIYASVSNSFRPVRTVGDNNYVYLDNKGRTITPNSTGKVYAPERGMQYEAGIHSRIGSLLTLELAGFHIEKSNIVQKFGKNADGKSVIGQVGTVHSDGFEIDATLTPSPYIDLRAGYTLTLAKVGEYSSTEFAKAAFKGNYLPYSPVHTAFGWLFLNNNSERHLFRLGLGFDYASESYADLANEMRFDPAFVANAMVSYRYNKFWTLQLNADNLFDKRYAKAAENTIQWLPEPGRNITVSAIFHM